MAKYYRNSHGSSSFPGIYVQGLVCWTYTDGVHMRLRKRGRISGALASSLEKTTREAAVAQWLDNRSRWGQQPLALPLGGHDLALTVALSCLLAAAGMALAFFGSYLAVHEAMGAYDRQVVIGAIGLGIFFGASGIWLITVAERMTRSAIRRAQRGV